MTQLIMQPTTRPTARLAALPTAQAMERTPSNSTACNRAAGRRRPRRGFTLLEFEVAMVVLGIALVGLLPLAVVHSRVMKSLEDRYSSQGEWYLAASQNRWEQKLGAAASLSDTDPGPMPEPPLLLIDDGAVEYGDNGWIEETDAAAFEADRRRASLVEGLTAVWMFTDVPAGWYQVQATWTEAPTQANNALYSIYDGEDLVGETTIDQQTAPDGVEYEDWQWQTLDTKYFDAGTVGVQLHSQATSEVVADGVRLSPVKNDVQILSIDRSLDSEEATVHVLVNVQVPE